MKIHLLFSLVLMAFYSFSFSQENFYAYYTRINSDEAWEVYSRTDEYADLVVQVNEGKLIFHRGTSYLPYWKTETGRSIIEEIIPRNGDGTDIMPDRFNAHSQVKIIENNPARIIVNWHYVPELKLIHEKKWVDEDFIIYPEGRLIRIIRAGSQSLEDWENKNNRIIKKYNLAKNGIEENEEPTTNSIQIYNGSSDNFIIEKYDEAKENIVIRTIISGAPGNLLFSVSELDHPKLLLKHWGNVPLKEIKINSKTFLN